MKQIRKWLMPMLALCLLLGILCMATGCSGVFTPLFPLNGSQETERGESNGGRDQSETKPSSTPTDTPDPTGPTDQKTSSTPSDVTVNQMTVNVVIEGTGAQDFSVAASRALLNTVSIYCTYTRTVSSHTGTFDPWSWFGMGGTSGPYDETYYSAGSGVIWKLDKAAGDAYILTNYHVVFDADCNTENHISDNIEVYLFGSEVSGAGIRAEYVGGSMYYDLAVLKISGSERLRASCAAEATFCTSDRVAAGQWVMAVGNPEAEGISVTAGVVSVPSEYIEMTGSDNRTAVSFRVIRVDAPVNSGNSGGGLYNAAGELIGIVNAKVSTSEVENIGYAIPVSVARAICANIIDYCDGKDCENVRRGLLGITVQATDSRAVFDPESALVGIEETIKVYEVQAGGIAEGCLRAGDRLLSITVGGHTTTVTRQYHVVDAMLDARGGDTVTVTFERDGEIMSCDMVVTEDSITDY